jgi:hypothetical protein
VITVNRQQWATSGGLSGGVGGTGTLVISSFTATGASGTFSFVAAATSSTGATGTKTVTNGTFNVTF